MRTLLSLVVLWVALGQVRTASAQDENARAAARALAQEGAVLFEKDDFQAALDKFKQAHERFPSPKLFLNIAQALRGLLRDVEALDAFQRFLDKAKDAAPEFREQATAQVAELSGKLAKIVVECKRPGAEVVLDGNNVGTVPLSKSIVVVPGRHTLALSWEGETQSFEVVAEAGQEVAHSVDFVDRKPLPVPAVASLQPETKILPLVEIQQAAPNPPKARSHAWYWIAGGAVVAATVTALILIYGSGDRYPSPTLGTRAVGGSP